ncbi:hypothetical protein MLD38_018533 [Melastoma candidum]|uniref:Uncharacterized protein n=1 Tax=Melastoma candidum TaxID=119954 RepID=A0ACB9QVF1_9MYRT|nr:hypothetical protein MLD38_018533 [Melastoma candidum]
MSLYIGNLPSHISQEDLEYVFRKFGRCRIQMKDGFGFAVYEFRGNAERALRELRGRNICGEAVTLTWSNKQPRPYQSFGRGTTGHDSRRGSYVYRGTFGRRGYNLSHRDSRPRFYRFESDGGDGHYSADVFNEEKVVRRSEDIGSSSRDVSCHSVEDIVVGRNSIDPADSGRWGVPAQMLPELNGPAPGDGVDFDRYKPYRSYEENNDDESHQINCEGGSESLGISRHDDRQERTSEYPSPDPIPSVKKVENTNQDNHGNHKEKYGRIHGGTQLKSRYGSFSERETSSTSRNLSDGSGAVPKKNHKILRDGNSYQPEGTDTSQKNDNGRQRQGGKRKSDEKLKQPRNSKRSVSSALRGQSPEGLHSTGVRSPFSYSMASSLSGDSENRSRRSPSRSRSFSSLSPPASPDQLLATSPDKAPLNEDDSIGNATVPSSQDDPNDNVELAKDSRTTEVGNTGGNSSTTVAGDETGILVAEKSYSVDHDHSFLADGADVGAVTLSPDNMKMSGYSSMEDSLDACQKASCEKLLETDNHEVFPKGHEAGPSNSSPATAINSSNSAKPSSILAEYIIAVLNHYGLEVPKENEGHASAEEFFGSARMWPWPIIYYRRLRKGPISVDNYAKRVLQNKEYGIVDKFVRSSSGWGELTELTD